MECISPINIRNPAEEKQRITVPCGRCLFCLSSKRNEWSFRLWQEVKIAESAVFLTMTYADEHLLWNHERPLLYKPDLQKFIKRMRNFQTRKTKSNKQIRYYAVGEYGTKTKRPHYHMMAFNLHEKLLNEVTQIWDKGHIDIGECNPATIRYLTKYVINRPDMQYKDAPPFALMSKRPGS